MKFIYVLIEGREAEGRKAMEEHRWFYFALVFLLFFFFVFFVLLFA